MEPGECDHDEQRSGHGQSRQVPDPPDLAHVVGDRWHLRCERHQFVVGGSGLAPHGNEHDAEEHEAGEALVDDVPESPPGDESAEQADEDSTEHRPREGPHAGDDRRYECKVQRAVAQILHAGRRPAAGQQAHRERGQQSTHHPHDRGDGAGSDAGQSSEGCVVGRRGDRLAERGAVEPQRQSERDDRHHDQCLDLRPSDGDAGDGEFGADRSGERDLRSVGRHVGELGVGGGEKLGKTDRRHEQDHPRLVEESPDDGEVDGQADRHAEQQTDGEGGPERPAPLHHQQRKERGAGQAHVADREIDDLGRPVRQDDPERQQTDVEAVDDAVEYHLAGRELLPERRKRSEHIGENVAEQLAEQLAEHHPPSDPRKTARARSSRSASSWAGPSNRTWPFSRNTARSAIARATLSDCSTTIIVWPAARSVSM